MARFCLPFLYRVNPRTRERELSHGRVALFAAMLFVIVLGVLLASILSIPVATG